MENAGLFITKKHGDVTIMICTDEDHWEVYYKKPNYPFIFAFGIPSEHLPDEVFEIAVANIDEYDDLFD